MIRNVDMAYSQAIFLMVSPDRPMREPIPYLTASLHRSASPRAIRCPPSSALLGALVPSATFMVGHYELASWTEPKALIVMGGLVFSALTVFRWGRLAFGSPVKAFGFVVLAEGVVLPPEVVTHHFVRAAMARGAGQAIDDLLLHGELRGQQRDLVAIRDRLQAGGKAASQRTEAEWTEAGRNALAVITAAVRGEVPVAPAPAVRIETRPLPTEIEPVALADRTVTINGRARELVFRARASEVVAALHRPRHGDGEGARDLGRARSGSSDVLAVDRLVALLRAEGGTHLAVVGLGPDEVERAALSHPDAQSAWAELTQQLPAGKPYEIAPLVPLAVVARVGGGAWSPTWSAPSGRPSSCATSRPPTTCATWRSARCSWAWCSRPWSNCRWASA
jgi:hypothetical protein